MEEKMKMIPEERLNELLSILLPYGYSKKGNRYTGVSPYMDDLENIISIVANDENWSGVFNIIKEVEDDEGDEKHLLGYYKGIMKLIAPELYSSSCIFEGGYNVLDFYWAPESVTQNRFPVSVSIIKEK